METENTCFAGGIDMDIYEPVIAELRAQIEECERVIATLEMMRSKGVSTATKPAADGTHTYAGQVTFRNDDFFGMTTAEAAKKYLAVIKKTATAKEITEALTAGGWKSSSRNPVDKVRSIISRNPLFAFVNGAFGLSEWYPGRKGALKKTSSQAATNTDSGPTPEQVDEIIAQVSTLS